MHISIENISFSYTNAELNRILKRNHIVLNRSKLNFMWNCHKRNRIESLEQCWAFGLDHFKLSSKPPRNSEQWFGSKLTLSKILNKCIDTNDVEYISKDISLILWVDIGLIWAQAQYRSQSVSHCEYVLGMMFSIF